MESTALAAAGYQVSVICPMGRGFEAEYECIEGIHIYRHPLPPESSARGGYLREYASALRWEFRLARRVWRERRFEVVHICNPPDLLFLVAGWFKLRYGVRVIFDQHDICPEVYEVKYGRRDLFYHGLRIAERLTFATASVVISTNESYRDVAVARGGKSPADIFIVRSGPDLRRFQALPPDPTYRNGRRYLVGYVGVMGEQEGIDRLLRAVRYIVHDRRRTDIQFTLVGSGPVLASLKMLARELKIADFVEFAGRVSDHELIARLSTCDVCVNPDPKNDFNDRSTMNKILEYMALGKPVVQFDLLEGRRSAAGASLYADPWSDRDFANKILSLIDDVDMRATMGAIGRARMECDLEWKHQVPKLLAAYDRCLDRHPTKLLADATVATAASLGE